jgi:cell division protein FtsW
MPRQATFDPWLLAVTVVLAGGGLLMVGSSSNYFALDTMASPFGLWWKHGLFALVGAAALAAILLVPYQRLAEPRLLRTLLAVTLGLLVLVLAMPAAGGAHRWIPLGPIKIQPSEFAKLVCIVYLALRLSEQKRTPLEPRAILGPLIVAGMMAGLVLAEPDLGTSAMIILVAGVMIFAAGLHWKWIAAMAGLGSVGLLVSIAVQPYRLVRLRAFLDPTADPLGASFQLNQSLIAIGSGGFAGTGLGSSQQKAFYLPAAHTDFVFSVVGEELGLAGCAAVLAAFLLLYWRGIRVALRAPDRFGSFLALGLTHALVLQALVNLSVCVGLLPTKGLPLPFLSYGGSSLVASMMAMGLLLNVSQYSN